MLRLFKSIIPCTTKAKDRYRLEEMKEVSSKDSNHDVERIHCGGFPKEHSISNGKMRVELEENGITVKIDSQKIFLEQFKPKVILWVNSLNQLISVSDRDLKIWELIDNKFECKLHSSWFPRYSLGGVSIVRISFDKRLLLIQYLHQFILFDLVAKQWTLHTEEAIDKSSWFQRGLLYESAVSSSKFATYNANIIKVYDVNFGSRCNRFFSWLAQSKEIDSIRAPGDVYNCRFLSKGNDIIYTHQNGNRVRLCLYHLETRSSVNLLDAERISDLKISEDETHFTFIDKESHHSFDKEDYKTRAFRLVDLQKQPQLDQAFVEAKI
jgi:hypothetical protein